MKIGYMYNLQVFPPRGGNHVHALELTKGFIEAGHEVLVFDDPSVPGAQNYESDTPGALEAFADTCDVLYIRIDGRELGRWPEAADAMGMVGNKPVVWEINAPANETLAFSWLGGKRTNVKESWFRKLKRGVHAARKMLGIRKEEKLRRALAGRVDAAICVSTALGRYAKDSLGIENVMVLPNGGPLIPREEIERRRSQRTSKAFTVFYSGSAIYPWQGLDLLAGAISLAQSRAPDIRFVLAVNQRTEYLPDGPNVEIREGLNRESILDSICCADACVALHPEYPWSPYGFHNSPMKLFEYMACMRPVITSNRGQMAELIAHGKNGLLCSDSAEDILQQFIRLRDHPGLAKSMGLSGWNLIQQEMNWKINAEKTIFLFDKLVYP